MRTEEKLCIVLDALAPQWAHDLADLVISVFLTLWDAIWAYLEHLAAALLEAFS